MKEMNVTELRGKIARLMLTVSRYRQGQVTVRVDFKRNILIWKDSNRWFNDFVRSLTEQQSAEIIETLPNLLKNCEVPNSYTPDPEANYYWTLELRVSGDSEEEEVKILKCAGINNESDDFNCFLSKIESVSEQIIDPIGGH